MIERNVSNPRLVAENESVLSDLESIASGLGIEPTPDYRSDMVSVKNRRWRRTPKAFEDRMGLMTLRQQDGVLLLDDALPHPGVARPGRRGRRPVGRSGELVARLPFARLSHGDIPEALETLDAKLTPYLGLRELRDGSLREIQRIRPDGKVLLLVHGTFSNNDNLLETLDKTPHGQAFLANVIDGYDQIATFDHRTLGVSPFLNAHELARFTRGSQASIDVICHSRGGLVTRWWLEALDRGAARRRAVFVGCPLAGTGLAAPTNIRASLSMMANVNRALAKVSGAASAALPFLTVATGVFRVIASITNIAAKTPVVDAAVGLVPGLYSMARIGNNRELLSLRRDLADVKQRYYAVTANFEPEDEGWRFWRYFRDPKKRLADWATDQIFDGANDLVVDSPSMIDLTDTDDLPRSQVLDFGTTAKVHHTNYFEQRRTLSSIARWLTP